jgi:hypothetical protein
MKVTKFAKKITEKEGKKVNLPIAQVLEVLAVINRLTGGVMYGIIRLMK